ncbi:hypothetical protein FisN_12Lu171 [Fistulifera solaris]|uniref:Uncharacterized protein n=1 Tax=Fistulifera solaris TaxID=1519565 RepID=A0A1Z5JMH9_FISSO|nr:hypothetical protein FisN_12Lu171 [Fistulifera solaris]|eukprot:GAX15220.1 hypothetical protein FisN_12Lu171 [Fistulifera solaris]
MSSAIDDSLFELIPESQVAPDQVTKYRSNGEVWPAYKFRRTPESVSDFGVSNFGESKPEISVLQENGTRILMVDSYIEWYCDAIAIDPATFRFKRNVKLAKDERCCLLFLDEWNFAIIGTSDHAIAETATFLWSLKRRWLDVRILGPKNHFDFSVVSLDQLTVLFQSRPRMAIKLQVHNINPDQSRFLADYPDRLDLTLDLSSEAFADGGDTFVDVLLERESWFGNLTLFNKDYSNNENFDLLLQAEALDSLVVPCVHSPELVHQVFSALVNEINVTIEVPRVLGLDWTTVDITPKDIAVSFQLFYESEDQTEFVCSFLRRLAELGNFRKFDFSLSHMRRELPRRVADALVDALVANQGLEELALHRSWEATPYFDSIIKAAERHEELVFLRIDSYPKKTDPQYAMLRGLLNRNRSIRVVDYDFETVTNGDEIDRLYAFNRFFQDLQSFPMETLSLQSSLLGEALTQKAASDFRWSSFLMANHMDSLCELVQYSSLLSSDTHDNDTPEWPADVEHVLARKRKIGCLSSRPCKPKR